MISRQLPLEREGFLFSRARAGDVPVDSGKEGPGQGARKCERHKML